MDSFLWTGIAHLCMKSHEHRPVFWIVIIDQGHIGSKYHFVLKVTLFFLADQRVNKQPVVEVERSLLQHFVSDVRDVPRLEANNRLPPFSRDFGPRFCRRHSVLAQWRLLYTPDYLDPAAGQSIFHIGHFFYAGVTDIICLVDCFCAI